MSPARIISTLLDRASGLSLTEGTNLFIGREPSNNLDTVTLYNLPAVFDSSDRLGIDESVIQVRVRNSDYETGYALMRGIQKELQSWVADSEIFGGEYSIEGIWLINSPMQITHDNRRFNLFTVSYRLSLLPADAGNRLQIGVTGTELFNVIVGADNVVEGADNVVATL